MRVLVITTMRNEAPFILEWIAYHQHIGVTDFLIYTNDCEDGTDLLLDRLQDLGVVTHERNHSRGKKAVQWRALSKAQRHPLRKKADWVYVTDVDEFLCIHKGNGKISDLIEAMPDADGFAIPWRMFGNAGVVDFQDSLITQTFTRAAPDRLLWPWRAVQFKSLYKNTPEFEKLGIHRPKTSKGDLHGHWVDGNGGPLPARFGTTLPTLEPRYGLAQINHYALGAMESFLVKVARGRPNHTTDPIDLAYWTDRNFNTIEDTSMLLHADAIRLGIDALKADVDVVRLHDAGVAWRAQKVQELLTDSSFFYMMARILQMPGTQVLNETDQKSLFKKLMHVRQLQALRKREL